MTSRRRDRRRSVSELRSPRARGNLVPERDDGSRVDGGSSPVDPERTDRRSERVRDPPEPPRQPLHASRRPRTRFRFTRSSRASVRGPTARGPQKSALADGLRALHGQLQAVRPARLSRVVVRVHDPARLTTSRSRTGRRQSSSRARFGRCSTSSLGAKADNVLLFTHQMLPHAPWRFFPSGAEYD